MSIKDNPNRTVRTKDSIIAFIGHKLETDGDILVECFVNSQTNEVTWRSLTKAQYNVHFVEADEDVQPLIDAANKIQDEQREAGIVPVNDRPIFNIDNLQPQSTKEYWETLGYSSKEEWKAAGKPDTPKV